MCYVKCVTKGKNKAKDVTFSSLLLLFPLLLLSFSYIPCFSLMFPDIPCFPCFLLPRRGDTRRVVAGGYLPEVAG